MKGCGKPSHGKPYCLKHITAAQRRALPAEMQSRILSGCCDAHCVTGAVHESGEQYCKACKEPCHWKAPQNKTASL